MILFNPEGTMSHTRERIIAAGFQLFESRPFEDVSVEDILQKAYVSRGTFYRYFHDKYELMYLYYSDFLNKNILAEFNGSNWYDLQVECYRFGAEHKRFFRNVKDSHEQDGFWWFLKDVSCAIFRDIKRHNAGRAELTEEEEFTIQCYVETAVFAFRQIVFSRTNLPVEVVSKIVYDGLPDEYKIYLDTKE